MPANAASPSFVEIGVFVGGPDEHAQAFDHRVALGTEVARVGALDRDVRAVHRRPRSTPRQRPGTLRRQFGTRGSLDVRPRCRRVATDRGRRLDGEARRRPVHRDLVGLPRRRADARLPRLPRVEVARRVRRVGRDLREPVRRSPQPRGLPQLGLAIVARRSSRTTASSPRCSSRTRSRRSSRPGCSRRTSRRAATTTTTGSPGSGRTTGGSPTSAPRSGPPCGHRADLPLRRRRRGEEIERGAGGQPLRRDPASGRGARLGAPAALCARVRADLVGLRRPRHADQQPRRARPRPTSGATRRPRPCSSSS